MLDGQRLKEECRQKHSRAGEKVQGGAAQGGCGGTNMIPIFLFLGVVWKVACRLWGEIFSEPM